LYKIQMIPALKPSDQVARTNFAVDVAERIDASPDFLLQVCFSGEATFHVSGVVNKCNCRIWGIQNPHVTCKMEKGSPKVNVWVSLTLQCRSQYLIPEGFKSHAAVVRI
jgi:hypothetical protein